ncbi:MAG: hypothetical protein WKF79_03360 [Nocardioides sp.]
MTGETMSATDAEAVAARLGRHDGTVLVVEVIEAAAALGMRASDLIAGYNPA